MKKSTTNQNALKHGLAAKTPLIPGEDPEEFEAFRSEFESAIAPVNVMKSELVDRIVLLKWKLRRIDRIEELEARFEFAMKILQSAKQEVVELASEMNHPCVWGASKTIKINIRNRKEVVLNLE